MTNPPLMTGSTNRTRWEQPLYHNHRRQPLDANGAIRDTSHSAPWFLASGQSDYLSFGVGLYAGATLIQTYFHEFSKPLPSEQAPPPPLSPIKNMSYAIQAFPQKPWKQLTILAVLFLWVLYQLAARAIGMQ